MGVISLHAEAPHEFVRADLDFLEHTASLMSGAVENARLYEEAAARVDLLTTSPASCSGSPARPRSSTCSPWSPREPGDSLGLIARRSTSRMPTRRLRLREADLPRRDDRNIDTRTLWFDAIREQRAREREGRAPAGHDLVGRRWSSSFAMFARSRRAMSSLGLSGGRGVGAESPAPTPRRRRSRRTRPSRSSSISSSNGSRKRTPSRTSSGCSGAQNDPGPELDGMAERLGCDLDSDHLVVHVQPWRAASPRGAGGTNGGTVGSTAEDGATSPDRSRPAWMHVSVRSATAATDRSARWSRSWIRRPGPSSTPCAR